MRGRTPLVTALLLALTSGVAAAAPVAHGLTTKPAAAPSSTPLSNTHAHRASVSTRVQSALGPGGEMRGMALNDATGTRPLVTSIADFERMKLDGITSVTAYIYLYVPDPSGTVVSSGLYTPTDQELQLVSTAAKAVGLDVHYMPVLLDAGNDFRGIYQPSDTGAFFASYTASLNHYADLAQANGVTLMYVGSENDEIARWTTNWRQTIASVRGHYSGALSYMTTGYRGPGVRFWDALDIISVSPYYSLGDEKVATYQRMLSAWTHDHLPYLASVAKAYKKPLVLGEIGYHSETGGYTVPAHTTNGLPAPQAQADAYRALLDALKTSPFIYGLTWWRWGPSAAVDTTYSPAGKPAECVIATYWSSDSTVRTLASLPVCDLSVVDTITNQTGVGQKK